MMVRASGYGPSGNPINSTPIELNSYEHLKRDLIRANVFSPIEWNAIDKIQNQVKKVNDFNSNKPKVLSGSRIYWAVEYFDTLWNLVAKKYIEHGGDYNDLVKPMRIKNLEKSLPKIKKK